MSSCKDCQLVIIWPVPSSGTTYLLGFFELFVLLSPFFRGDVDFVQIKMTSVNRAALLRLSSGGKSQTVNCSIPAMISVICSSPHFPNMYLFTMRKQLQSASFFNFRDEALTNVTCYSQMFISNYLTQNWLCGKYIRFIFANFIRQAASTNSVEGIMIFSPMHSKNNAVTEDITFAGWVV